MFSSLCLDSVLFLNNMDYLESFVFLFDCNCFNQKTIEAVLNIFLFFREVFSTSKHNILLDHLTMMGCKYSCAMFAVLFQAKRQEDIIVWATSSLSTVTWNHDSVHCTHFPETSFPFCRFLLYPLIF